MLFIIVVGRKYNLRLIFYKPDITKLTKIHISMVFISVAFSSAIVTNHLEYRTYSWKPLLSWLYNNNANYRK